MDGTALVLCEGKFSSDYGKTAHGLVRHTDRYEIIGVIDSTLAGPDIRIRVDANQGYDLDGARLLSVRLLLDR